MASLQDSLRLKSAGQKAPATSGQAPVRTPDTPLAEGKSGGVARSKQVKNAGSKFAPGVDKTVGYF